ncbi:MAG: aldo/keto reductase, partial [Anaerolineales bacterium]|nr:aldo/keto reductase [Anaerolineales bacterium]
DGRSETLIGEVLSELVAAGRIARENVIIVTKAGYVQGQNYEMVQARKAAGRPFPNLVKVKAGLDHCIHPEFLADQLTRSLERLQLETIDVFLLHNPEYYLSWAHVANIPLHEARREYYRRIKLAFQYLETEVAQGRIQWYGISSNTFPIIKIDAQFTSLERVWEIAESLLANHHFRIIQMPLNLFETGGVTNINLNDDHSTLSFARQKNLGVLINRPLNAYHKNTLIRLVDVLPSSYPTTPEEVSTVVDTLVDDETVFQQHWLPTLDIDADTRRQLQAYLAVGQVLQGQWGSFYSYHNWLEIQSQFLLPRAQAAITFLSNQENLADGLLTWLHGYIERVNDCLGAVSAFYQEAGHERAQRMQQTAVSAESAWAAETLSQTAVRSLRSSAGISAVLVGMRQVRYVDDMLSELKRPVTVKDRDEAWLKLSKMRDEIVL